MVINENYIIELLDNTCVHKPYLNNINYINIKTGKSIMSYSTRTSIIYIPIVFLENICYNKGFDHTVRFNLKKVFEKYLNINILDIVPI